MSVYNRKLLKGLFAMLLVVSVMITFTACQEKSDTGDDESKEETVVEKTNVELDKDVYAPGENIKVDYKVVDEVDSSAWIGIVPADTPHGKETDGDAVDIDYQKLQDKMEGSMTFNAPNEAGEYDIRIYSSDATGDEVFTVGFTVEADEEEMDNEDEEAAADEEMAADEEETAEDTEDTEEDDGPTLSLEEDTYAPGDEIEVAYTTPEGFDTSAWVGVVPSDIEHGKEEINDNHDLEYRYLHGEVEGTLTFTAPTEPGSYDLRMNESDQSGAEEVASITFTVK